MGHPIVAIWVLTIIALLMSMSGGEKHKESVTSTSEQKEVVVKQTENIADIKNKKAEEATPAITQEQGIVVASTTQAVVADKGSVSTEPEQEKISIEGLEDQSIDDLLLMARESYWNNGLDEAAAIYQQLIQREPKVVSHKGELGNVYWKQGFPEKSAHLYAEIALPMIESGHTERVSQMVGFIGLFHPEKATEIKKRLQGLKAQN
jgi:hypothetical protein